jgi:heme-degrading monooxygenase HmoA
MVTQRVGSTWDGENDVVNWLSSPGHEHKTMRGRGQKGQ